MSLLRADDWPSASTTRRLHATRSRTRCVTGASRFRGEPSARTGASLGSCTAWSGSTCALPP